MKTTLPRHTLLALATIAAAVTIALWAWNTLAVPFALPEIDARHALAAFALLGMVRIALRPRRTRHGTWRYRRESLR